MLVWGYLNAADCQLLSAAAASGLIAVRTMGPGRGRGRVLFICYPACSGGFATDLPVTCQPHAVPPRATRRFAGCPERFPNTAALLLSNRRATAFGPSPVPSWQRSNGGRRLSQRCCRASGCRRRCSMKEQAALGARMQCSNVPCPGARRMLAAPRAPKHNSTQTRLPGASCRNPSSSKLCITCSIDTPPYRTLARHAAAI